METARREIVVPWTTAACRTTRLNQETVMREPGSVADPAGGHEPVVHDLPLIAPSGIEIQQRRLGVLELGIELQRFPGVDTATPHALPLCPPVPFLHDQRLSSQPTRHCQPACTRSVKSRWFLVERSACTRESRIALPPPGRVSNAHPHLMPSKWEVLSSPAMALCDVQDAWVVASGSSPALCFRAVRIPETTPTGISPARHRTALAPAASSSDDQGRHVISAVLILKTGGSMTQAKTTLAVSVIGDWLRNRLDPTLQ